MKTLVAGSWLALSLGALVSSNAASYVVDPSAPSAADSNPGTEQQPFRSIAHAAEVVQPGDTISVMGGAYDELVPLRISGTKDQPITIQSVPRRAGRVRGFDVRGSYIAIQGFEITAPEPAVAVQLHGSNCDVSDNWIHDMMVGVAGTVGTLVPGSQTRDYSAVAHNRIAYNKVVHSEYGFMLGGDDWLVENNEVDRLFMYANGKRFDDCDYSRFFGRGCVQRGNYYHGSTAAEIRVAHVDCLQTFTVNGEIAQDLVFEDNTCFDFHQMCMVESAPHLGNVRDWTFRHNIVSANSPTMSGGWGPDIIQTPNVRIDHNTISTVRWAAIGLRGQESTNSAIRNNILCHAERAVVDGDRDFTAARPTVENNLTFATAPLAGDSNINGKDPLFVDPSARNFRVRTGSPAIRPGAPAETIGALEYPNVYYVDPKHPAATDEPGWGYPAVPLATLRRACALAKSGETIVLRGGTYRETLRPPSDGVTVRAMAGETAVLSGADLIEGWQRQANGAWTAALTSKPQRLLRDGKPWTDFDYDAVSQRIRVKGSDPRLHVFETVVRKRAIELGVNNGGQIQGIRVVDTLGE